MVARALLRSCCIMSKTVEIDSSRIWVRCMYVVLQVVCTESQYSPVNYMNQIERQAFKNFHRPTCLWFAHGSIKLPLVFLLIFRSIKMIRLLCACTHIQQFELPMWLLVHIWYNFVYSKLCQFIDLSTSKQYNKYIMEVIMMVKVNQ